MWQKQADWWKRCQDDEDRNAGLKRKKEAHLATMCRLAVVLPRLWRDTALPGALEPPSPTPPPGPPPSTVSRSLARDMPSLPLSRLAVPATLHADRHATWKGRKGEGWELRLRRLAVPPHLLKDAPRRRA